MPKIIDLSPLLIPNWQSKMPLWGILKNYSKMLRAQGAIEMK
jgi:hypothetical protein